MSEGPSERNSRIFIGDDNPGDVPLLRLALDDAQLDCELAVIDVAWMALESNDVCR